MKNKLPTPKIGRWSEGVDHDREADALARLIGDMDFQHSELRHFVLCIKFDDLFGLKYGGDGDNGETLAFILDALIENGLIKIDVKT